MPRAVREVLPLRAPLGTSELIPSPGVLPALLSISGGRFAPFAASRLVCDELHLNQMFRGQENLFEVKSQ